MPEIMEIEEKEAISINNLNSLHISSIEDDDDDEEEAVEIDEDGEEEEDDEEPVILGFVKKPKYPNSLLRHLFPSKAGGVPAWLDPIDLPSGKSRLCGFCEEPLQFLLQAYAPLSNKESTFHRTLFVFMCSSMACLLRDQHEQWKRHPAKQSRSVKVFRCQLRRSNLFYSSDPPKCDDTDKPLCAGAALCHWCGTWKGDKICSSCKSARYCSAKHQVMDWRSGHKLDCQRMSISLQTSESMHSNGGITLEEITKVGSTALWPEFEIESDNECEIEAEASEHKDSSSLVSKDEMDGINSVMKTFEGDDDKKSWASFQERIARDPEQVLRYSSNVKAKPLWPMSSGRPSNADIPKCNYCDGPRCYEFQILPQLLYYFGVKNDVDSLDWATIVVYTCANSCEANISYKEEFAWVQIPSSA
ncbi:Programmed cell death protein [Thalictrum thalictroides]|uniref:Programmed cell death protein n=1 Tax=Thalictrum thalictroides TaxID=46969 RepID=A0A7J6W0Z9_THATH|nr:Programmed cell death protein [Thalictrum thalictroides]